MQQRKIDSTDDGLRKTPGKERWKTPLHWLFWVFLILITWVYPLLFLENVSGSLILAGSLGVLYALSAILLERCLASTNLRRDWQYRLAFVASAALAFVQVFVLSILPSMPVSGLLNASLSWTPAWWEIPMLLIATTTGSFTGALVATGINDGLVESNNPPAEMTLTVYQEHLAIIGMPGAAGRGKRIFDGAMSLFGLFISAPVWITSTVLVWLEDPGPVLFVKNSVGKGGVNIRLYKFRTMVRETEISMALVQTQEVSAKTLVSGRILRKTALDELPQLVNILKGEMSFVGPRPHRTPLVALYLKEMPEFAERHSVLPGLAGLAQVSGDFYMTPRQKLRFDRLYIRHRSLGFDVKLITLAFLITFWYRWQKGWDGRLPRKFLHEEH